MEKNKEYEPVRIEFIYFDERDVIATSGEGTDDTSGKTVGEPFWSNSGWT